MGRAAPANQSPAAGVAAAGPRGMVTPNRRAGDHAVSYNAPRLAASDLKAEGPVAY
jgi:hypothetical protein